MLFGYIDPDMLAGPGVTSWAKSPEGLRSERYVIEDVLDVVAGTTGADLLAGGPSLADVAGADEAAFGDVSELRWTTTSTAVTAAATPPRIVKTSVRRRRTAPPKPSCLRLATYHPASRDRADAALS